MTESGGARADADAAFRQQRKHQRHDAEENDDDPQNDGGGAECEGALFAPARPSRDP